MFLGFSDQDAIFRVLGAARPQFSAVRVSLNSWKGFAEARPGEHYPSAWLFLGRFNLELLRYAGRMAITPSMSVGGTRCLVPSIDEDGRDVMLAGVWALGKYERKPTSFHLVEASGDILQIAPSNWGIWLDPRRDVRAMLFPRDNFVVPGQTASRDHQKA